MPLTLPPPTRTAQDTLKSERIVNERVVPARDAFDSLAQMTPAQKARTVLFPTDQMERASTSTTQASSVTTTAPVSDANTPITSTAQVEEAARAVVAKAYPELAGANFRVRTFHESGFNFECKPSFWNVFKKTEHQTYTIEVNPDALDGTLTKGALEGILAHEIGHGLNTHDHGVGGFVDLGLSFLSKKHLHKDERQTDLEAIARGYGDGLASYREWIYPRLTPEQLATKKATYYQPDEIRQMTTTLAQHPEVLATWRSNPPMTLAQMTL